ncbi:unnamed protein product [Larinioides sclopetarius]|uniref:Uncharacterized protein n=1 Tax=Larinioides sclopetarius TaxID=280406 RepID=A0AAV2AUG1_9ARAC
MRFTLRWRRLYLPSNKIKPFLSSPKCVGVSRVLKGRHWHFWYLENFS